MTNNEKKQEITVFLSDSTRHVEMFESLVADKDATIFNLENELNWLKQQVKLGQQKIFGRSTEKLEFLQVSLVFNEDESEVIEVKEVNEKTETIQYTRRKVKQCGRKLDTSKLIRERQLHDYLSLKKYAHVVASLKKLAKIHQSK